MQSKYIDVLGSQMHYRECGNPDGDPILFLHGNPTSSYLWRNIMPHLAEHGRCIAPDLIGMGQSDKPDIDYRFVDHSAYLDAFIELMGLKNITLVIHDWGSALGFYYAHRFEANVKGIAFMEGIVQTVNMADIDDPKFKYAFKAFRTPGLGQFLIQRLNVFAGQLLPASIIRKLDKDEMQTYLAPYPDYDSRKPLWRWPNEIPFDGTPSDVHTIVSNYRAWLEQTQLPKLLLWVKPGALIKPKQVPALEAALPNLKTVNVGKGIHFIQEDEPDNIGQAVSAWMAEQGL